MRVTRHDNGFGIKFIENRDIGIFSHCMVFDYMTQYRYNTYFIPISTSWFRRFGTGCIVRNGEWRMFENTSVFSARFRVLFEEGIICTPVQKDATPPTLILNYNRSKPIPLKWICVYWEIFVYFSLKYCLKNRSTRFNTIPKAAL